MSDKTEFKVVILWEDELRAAGIKLKEFIDLNDKHLNSSKKKTKKQFEEFVKLEQSVLRLCYTALQGIDKECTIVLSRKPEFYNQRRK